MNSIQLIGRLTADPELRFTANGTEVCKFRLAVNRYDGGADYIDVVTFKRQAEVCAEHLAKGRMVGVSGRLSHSEWQADDGSKRSKHEVVAESVDFLGDRSRTDGDNGPAPDVPVAAVA